jgi:hypothetical protein
MTTTANAAPPVVRTAIVVTSSDPAGPISARCQACAATWVRAAGATDAGELAAWSRDHRCAVLPAGLDDLAGPASAELAGRLHTVALAVLERQLAASTVRSRLVAGDDEAFWRATGRHEGLLEAHTYLLAVTHTLTARGGPR